MLVHAVTHVRTCPRFIDDVIPYDVRTVCKVFSYGGPESSKTIPETIAVVVQVLIGNTGSFSDLIQTPVMLGTILKRKKNITRVLITVQ